MKDIVRTPIYTKDGIYLRTIETERDLSDEDKKKMDYIWVCGICHKDYKDEISAENCCKDK